MANDPKREFLRHTVATLAYRAGKTLREVPENFASEKIFQGPIADAFTHVGQIAMLRRLAGAPVRGENYQKAEIEIGRVGPMQSNQRMEFNRENETGKIIFAQ